MNRGNSIIAGVVLVGILGSLSIALQATTPTTENIAAFQVKREAQVAQSAAGQIPPIKTPEKKEPSKDPQAMGCFEGFEYAAITRKDGTIKTICHQRPASTCKAAFDPSSKINSKEAYEKAGALPECIQAVEKSARLNANNPSCKVLGSGECSLHHCFEDPSSKPSELKPRACVRVQNGKFNEEQGFAPANNQDFGLKQLVKNAADGNIEQEKLLKGLSADKTFEQGIKNAFADQAIEQERKVQEAIYVERAACALGDQESCSLAQKAIAEERKKLDAIQAMQKNLGPQQTGETGGCPPPCQKPAPPTSPEAPTRQPSPTGSGSPSGQQSPQQGRQASTFPPQQQQQNPFQQCSPQYFCQNNALYWGSPQQQQQNQQPQYNFFTGSYTYPQQCQNQFVQACQYGCEQQQGTQYSTRCAQNPQQQTPTTPVASLSCGGEGALFDVGMSVPITFSCTNSVSSTGNGFSTGGVLTGSASPVIQKPPAGADIVSYGLTCTASNNQTASKRCDAKINVTTIVVVANPKSVQANASTTIGWVTRGMKTCVISSPNAPSGSPLEAFNQDNADIKNVSGVAVTPPLSSDTEFQLSCVTKADQPKSSIIRVRVGS